MVKLGDRFKFSWFGPALSKRTGTAGRGRERRHRSPTVPTSNLLGGPRIRGIPGEGIVPFSACPDDIGDSDRRI
jgi:hypothetical protein